MAACEGVSGSGTVPRCASCGCLSTADDGITGSRWPMVGAGHGRRNVSIETAPRPGPLPGQAIQKPSRRTCTPTGCPWPNTRPGPAPTAVTSSGPTPAPLCSTGWPAPGSTSGETDARIAEVLQRFRAWGAGVTWLTGPSTTPPDLGQRLEAARLLLPGRLDRDGARPERGRAAGQQALRGLTVSPADGGATRRVWLDVIGTAFGLPPAARGVFDHLPAGAEGRGARRDGGVATWAFSTAARLRGGPGRRRGRRRGVPGGHRAGSAAAGFATALTRHVLAEARALGYSLAVLQATDEGSRTLPQLGFVEYGVIGVYRWTPPRWGQRGRPARRLVRAGPSGLRWPPGRPGPAPAPGVRPRVLRSGSGGAVGADGHGAPPPAGHHLGDGPHGSVGSAPEQGHGRGRGGTGAPPRALLAPPRRPRYPRRRPPPTPAPTATPDPRGTVLERAPGGVPAGADQPDHGPALPGGHVAPGQVRGRAAPDPLRQHGRSRGPAGDRGPALRPPPGGPPPCPSWSTARGRPAWATSAPPRASNPRCAPGGTTRRTCSPTRRRATSP